MLGTQAQYPNPYSTEAALPGRRSWRKLMIAVALLALIGIGGWWMYQNSIAGQAQSAPAQPTVGTAPAVTGQLASSSLTSGVSAAQPPSLGSASASAVQGAVEGAASTAQAAESGLKLASLAGVAEVTGTPVWSDDGTLLATLESGSLLTVKARTDDDSYIDVTTASLDDPDAFPPTHHSWLSHHIAWIKFSDGLPTFQNSRDDG